MLDVYAQGHSASITIHPAESQYLSHSTWHLGITKVLVLIDTVEGIYVLLYNIPCIPQCPKSNDKYVVFREYFSLRVAIAYTKSILQNHLLPEFHPTLHQFTISYTIYTDRNCSTLAMSS